MDTATETSSLNNRQSDKDHSDSDPEFALVIATIDQESLKELALSSRNGDISGISCSIALPPRVGSHNIVYQVSFSDGVQYAIRIPGESLSPAAVRSMELDILAQKYIASHTSLPIPRIHFWSASCDNSINRPFVVMDFIPGINLSKLWHDKSWMTSEKRTHILDQLAVWMTELSEFEFDYIGKLDIDKTTGAFRVIAFPDSTSLFQAESDDHLDDASGTLSLVGPFSTVHAFLSYKLSIRRKTSDSPMLALLQLFLHSLPDSSLDGPPFVLRPPDFDFQNVLVADDGTITGLIDWDGVFVGPRQGGAAAYPSWLTTDWDPVFHGWNRVNTPEENSGYDSPEELMVYRQMYVEAIHRASGGRLTNVTKNSHVFEALDIAVSNSIATSGVVDHMCKFVFGSGVLGWKVEEGIKNSSWFGMKVDDMAQVLDIPSPDPSDTESEES